MVRLVPYSHYKADATERVWNYSKSAVSIAASTESGHIELLYYGLLFYEACRCKRKIGHSRSYPYNENFVFRGEQGRVCRKTTEEIAAKGSGVLPLTESVQCLVAHLKHNCEGGIRRR